MTRGDTAGDPHTASQADCLCESRLPAPLREALRLARKARPQRQLCCLVFHSEENGRQVARLGPTCAAGLRANEVMVLSVTVTETTNEEVRTVSDTLVIRIEAGT